MSDDAGTGQWMTYDELAEVRGIKRIGAVRLVQRYKWRRQAGNDGRARVLVPHDALEKVRGSDAGIDAGAGAGHNDAGTDAGNDASTINDLAAGALAALETAVFSLTARAEQAEKGREAAEARADDLRARIERTEQELSAMQAQLAAKQEHVEALQAGQALLASTHQRELAIARGQLELELEAAREQTQRMREAAEALHQAEAERKGRGVLARLRAALRGE